MSPIAIKNIPGLQVTTLENKDSQLQRLGVLNDSYRKRYATYTKIAAMVVVFLVGFIVIQMVEPMLPGVVSNLLMIVLVLFVGYYIATYFSELGSRSTLNYDELNLPTTNPGEKDKVGNLTPGTSGDLTGDFSMCMDDSCCGTGSKYSSTLHKCIPNCNALYPETSSGANDGKKWYDPSGGTCNASNTGHSEYIDTSADGFTLGSSSYQTSGEQYVDRSRISLPIAAVGIVDTGLMPSNAAIEKYSSA